ncbi:D,D-heptose 1,7-bisphosphate phosphatase [Cylindrospermopsis raciborskii C04]|uniref:D,D-heptose 1,7-bisphosphate phosphatase n=1 Tax=Cylindrospermopsis raciborskii C07 TaxID=2014886 RepID=A0ABX4WII7_9CYAN|nr:HAD family hydrolase [Cylindrospermopsis raciborskii]PNJ92605.1 D,D-heptose 1,7-bisphosphate phosphatase [Cylindrospermopsis raciborskii C07]PNJ93431.1 D,D-heptose 1,7-bisphosphate phosphatase [Cylindrospermopsis raciborskii C03]PNJ95010.1 D,D-heptose 1,7-bisphosphate phosphatase [Cylindrospermopsis raciborskii C04]
MNQAHKAVFLDRDGVINRSLVKQGKPYPPATIDELEILPGVDEALISLKKEGFLLIVVTNQPDVARGKTKKEFVNAINSRLASSLPIDDFFTCFHDDSDNCDCRKPKPGSLFSAATRHNICLPSSFMVGDRWRDIEAGYGAGCRTIFIDYGYDEKQPDHFDFRVSSLFEAARIILKTPEKFDEKD